ncbi:N-acetyltransferase [Vibrio tritonius]|uniref:N-acetyltransferase n=1 Tax=Vibrio tritonius TaxID=1435069 RepID=UPI00315CD629
MENLRVQTFSEINLDDPFFNTLKQDYAEFSDWFNRKSDKNALVLYNDKNQIEGFLYCKREQGPGNDTSPLLPDTNHFKVGTFKFNPQQTRRGDRYLKKIFDYALLSNSQKVDDIYVTVFSEKHPYLSNLFKKYGFIEYGKKTTSNGVEDVLLRNLNSFSGDMHMDYPFINTAGHNKYLLGIYPEYHTRLFPDSILQSESRSIVKDISYSNSIHKIYICGMPDVMHFKAGDILIMYRTSDDQGPAEYRSVASSMCVVESVRHIDSFSNENEFVDYCIKFSVFNESELRRFYRQKRYPYIINFTYNIAFPTRPTRGQIADSTGINRSLRWGVVPLSDDQFQTIASLANLNKELLV